MKIKARIKGKEVNIDAKALIIKVDKETVKMLGIGMGTCVELLSPNQEKSQFNANLIVKEVLGEGLYRCEINSTTQ